MPISVNFSTCPMIFCMSEEQLRYHYWLFFSNGLLIFCVVMYSVLRLFENILNYSRSEVDDAKN